jgi:hypothetical protein
MFGGQGANQSKDDEVQVWSWSSTGTFYIDMLQAHMDASLYEYITALVRLSIQAFLSCSHFRTSIALGSLDMKRYLF